MIRLLHSLPGGYLGLLADPSLPSYEAQDALLTLQENDSGRLEFVIGSENPEFFCLINLKSEVIVYDGDFERWRGRVIRQTIENGIQLRVTCRGLMDYLHDGLVPAQMFSGPAADVLAQILAIFNASGVEGFKKFTAGVVSGIGNISYEMKKAMKCSALLTALVDEFGGSLKASRDGENNLLHWRLDTAEHREHCAQNVEFGKNLLDFDIEDDGEKLVTVLYGYGKDGLTFSDVNGGQDYVTNTEAQNEFGWVSDCIDFSDVEDAQELLSKTQDELTQRLKKTRTIDASAIDMSYADAAVEPFGEGVFAQLLIPELGIDESVMVEKIKCHLFNPTKTHISLGVSTLTASAIMRRNL